MRPVAAAPILPLTELLAVNVARALGPVRIMLAVVAIKSRLELSIMALAVDVIVTAEVAALAVVIALDAKFTSPADAVKVTVPASVLMLVTFNVPVVAVNVKSRPVVCMLVNVMDVTAVATEYVFKPMPASKSIVCVVF